MVEQPITPPNTPTPGPGPDTRSYAERPQPPVAPPARRRHRLLASLTATAVVAAGGGLGVGYTLARHHGSTTDLASGSTQAQTQAHGSTGSGSSSGSAGGSSSNGDGFGNWQQQLPSQPQLPDMPALPYGGGGSTQSEGQTSSTKAAGSQLTGLVRIITTMKYAGGKAAGTGMVLTSDGEVVTNHHVVAGATRVKVKVMATGRTYTAKVVGTDAKDDVAVLQLAGATGLATVTPDTSSVSTGEAVTAVGDGNGTVSYLSAAKGDVLGTGKTITTEDDGTAAGEKLTGLIEISSDVVSGFSGGATYDQDGHVVGMTTAASTGSSDIVGYAIPITKVLRVANDLENGVVRARYDYTLPAFLGVGLANGTTVEGVYAGTPAAKAGIVAGDRITAIDGTSVSTLKALRAAVAAHSPGDSISVTWTSPTGSRTATVTLVQGAVE
jgi:S1-C subfamily serine protease